MKMMLPALLKLLLVLATVSHGTATFCNITETNTCYGALGQSVCMYPFNPSFDWGVSFQGKPFFRYKHKTGFVDDACQSRCQFMTNGTIRMDNLMKNDAGIYAIEEYEKTGKKRGNMVIYLTIQDPVSPPALSQFCLSHGEIGVNCSSTGDDPQYNWALNNNPLDGGLLSSNETQTVILRRNVSGSITCTASNRVSSKHTTQKLQKCPDPVSRPALSQLCLPHGEIRVNCSSTGDDPQYSWALDNRTLDGGMAFLSDETQTVILRRNVSGSITCTASNRVSSKHTTQELQKCPDPVSPPALSQLCLSHGEIRVNCSSAGDDPQYSWALDNRTLDGGVAFLSDETQTVILRRNVSGSITCTASNRVSSKHTTQELQKCPDPVSPPALSQLCLSHGEIRVNCSSTGDDPQYSWALDNHTLDGGVAFLSNETQTVILRRNVSGSITCTASNRVSSKHTTQELQKCPGSLWNIVLPTVLGVCLLLMVLLLGICYLYKKQKQTKTSQRSAGDRCEDTQELVYCQVQVVKKKQRPKKQEQEPQVVYGEVKVSDASKAVRHSPNEQTETIYSSIRT